MWSKAIITAEAAGTWRKLGPFSATINDGNIDVRSTGIEANFVRRGNLEGGTARQPANVNESSG